MALPPEVVDFRHELVSTVLVSALIGGIVYPFKSAKKKWEGMISKLDEVHSELKAQRTNCLSTLQNQGDKQIELLRDTVKVLNDMHLDQRELLGKLNTHRSE